MLKAPPTIASGLGSDGGVMYPLTPDVPKVGEYVDGRGENGLSILYSYD
jgi:hypothetical protein